MSHVQSDKTATLVIHANPQKDQYGAIIMPIYQTSTFVFDNCDQGGNRFAGKEPGFMYTRIGNPSIVALEGKVAALEHAEDCAAAASGMGAIAATLWTILKAGDHMISDDCLYGCTHELFEKQFTKFGVDVEFMDTSDTENVKKHMKPNTRVIYFETPANPTMKMIDIQKIAEVAHSQEGVLCIVDNTFASPILCNPLDLGVDIVVHSGTKYINGHTDVVCGFSCGPKSIISKVKAEGIKDITGSVVSPHDAFLIMRGLMTLDLRVKKAAENAMKVARMLHDHPAVKKVYYPGLEDHPGHEIAAKQMKMFGSMISFDVDGFEKAKAILDRCKLVSLAVSLGGCESLIQHPASMTHAGVPKEEREAAGLTDNLIRLSVGIEDVDDIIADLKQALDAAL